MWDERAGGGGVRLRDCVKDLVRGSPKEGGDYIRRAMARRKPKAVLTRHGHGPHCGITRITGLDTRTERSLDNELYTP